MSSIDDLLTVAHTYGAAHGLDLSTVSWRALGDTKKLASLETGRDIQVRRLERTMQWFSDNWPAGTDWPADIERPTPAPAREAS